MALDSTTTGLLFPDAALEKPRRELKILNEIRPNSSQLISLDASDAFGYALIIISFSGGKDSLALLLKLLEMGVPKDRIELWHQCIDGAPLKFGGVPGLMDWACTESYVLALGAALGIRVRFQWKVGGFEGELLRENNRTKPYTFELRDGTLKTTGGDRGKESTRRKFPQVSADLNVRYCSSYLKIMVSGVALCNDPDLAGINILFVSGERREESPGRAKYAEIERHRSSSGKRRIDHWRAVIDWTEAEVWAIIARWRIIPHPAYYLSWSRCSCAGCIFNGASEWRTLSEIDPQRFNRIAAYEREFGLTIQRTESVIEQAARGTSLIQPGDEPMIALALSHSYPQDRIFVPEGEEWVLPRGAFRGGAGPS